MTPHYITRLQHLSTLPQDWDGEDALPVSPESIEEATILLKELEIHNLSELVVPGKNGEVIIEYGYKTRLIEIIIHPDRSKSMISFTKDKVDKEVPFNLEDFLEFVSYKEKSWWEKLFKWN